MFEIEELVAREILDSRGNRPSRSIACCRPASWAAPRSRPARRPALVKRSSCETAEHDSVARA